MADLKVIVVSADHEVWSGNAKLIVARTLLGEIGILVGHEPILAILAPGEVRITTTDGGLITASADDGFLSVEHDTVMVIARTAELINQA